MVQLSDDVGPRRRLDDVPTDVFARMGSLRFSDDVVPRSSPIVTASSWSDLQHGRASMLTAMGDVAPRGADEAQKS